jgi:hypothetical protein
MTLAMWTVFDVIWFLARLMGGADGERVVWASALNGGASLLLWAVSLLLLRDGDSGLWWLMRPSESVRALLLVAAYLRIGFYPFQIVHARDRAAFAPARADEHPESPDGHRASLPAALLPEAYGLPELGDRMELPLCAVVRTQGPQPAPACGFAAIRLWAVAGHRHRCRGWRPMVTCS